MVIEKKLPQSLIDPDADVCVCVCGFTGLDMDGLYRVSGNLAVIQKLRFKADHGNALHLCVCERLCSVTSTGSLYVLR